MIRTRTTLVPAALATVALALAAGPAAASGPAPSSTPTAARAAAVAKQVATTRDTGSAVGDPVTLVTRLLGLPGEGSFEALFEALGVPQDQAADLARKLSALATSPTVPGGGDLNAGG